MRLIDPKKCPCDGCPAKPCGHPAHCVKFALWLNDTVEAEPVKHTQLGEYYLEEFYGQWANCKECGSVAFPDGNYCPNCGRKITQGGANG